MALLLASTRVPFDLFASSITKLEEEHNEGLASCTVYRFSARPIDSSAFELLFTQQLSPNFNCFKFAISS